MADEPVVVGAVARGAARRDMENEAVIDGVVVRDRGPVVIGVCLGTAVGTAVGTALGGLAGGVVGGVVGYTFGRGNEVEDRRED